MECTESDNENEGNINITNNTFNKAIIQIINNTYSGKYQY